MRLIDADATLEQMKGMNMLFSPKIVIDNMPTISTEQIREEAIEEFRKFSYCKVCEEKGWDIYCEYCRVCLAQEYIAEQLKGAENG